MCEHEDRECPGRACRCECMNCMVLSDDETEELWRNAVEAFHGEGPYALENQDV
jgi:hypothetical protein